MFLRQCIWGFFVEVAKRECEDWSGGSSRKSEAAAPFSSDVLPGTTTTSTTSCPRVRSCAPRTTTWAPPRPRTRACRLCRPGLGARGERVEGGLLELSSVVQAWKAFPYCPFDVCHDSASNYFAFRVSNIVRFQLNGCVSKFKPRAYTLHFVGTQVADSLSEGGIKLRSATVAA